MHHFFKLLRLKTPPDKFVFFTVCFLQGGGGTVSLWQQSGSSLTVKLFVFDKINSNFLSKSVVGFLVGTSLGIHGQI